MNKPILYYLCEYNCGRGYRSSRTICATPETLNAVLAARCMGEWTISAPSSRPPYYRPLHEKLARDGCTLEVLHYALFIGELAIKSGAATVSEIIGDRGLIHEMTHIMQFPDEPLNPSLKYLVDMTLKIEKAIPGHPLTSRLSRERLGHSS